MPVSWPAGFARVPDDEWTRQPVEQLAMKYDTVENHGWYENLGLTVEEVAEVLDDGRILIDYSGGTGIFVSRLLERIGSRPVGVVIVDASAKFLRLSLEKFRHDPRVAYRLIRFLKPIRRLEFVDEVLPFRAHALASTNAIHLYYDLPDTLRSWRRTLVPRGRVFINSGNIRNPAAPPGDWIIDETVEAIQGIAERLCKERHRRLLADSARRGAYDALRRKYFLPVRPLAHYLHALREAGFDSIRADHRRIAAKVSEWYDFLSVYHEGVLGWIGGAEKIEGRPASEADIAERLDILRRSLESLFRGRPTFDCCWTYISASRPG